MTKKDMAAKFRSLLKIVDEDDQSTAFSMCEAAAAALEREAAAEAGKERPSLSEQVKWVMEARKDVIRKDFWWADNCDGCKKLESAAETLTRLREEGGKLLGIIEGYRQHSLTASTVMCRDILRSLGVTPT